MGFVKKDSKYYYQTTLGELLDTTSLLMAVAEKIDEVKPAVATMVWAIGTLYGDELNGNVVKLREAVKELFEVDE